MRWIRVMGWTVGLAVLLAGCPAPPSAVGTSGDAPGGETQLLAARIVVPSGTRVQEFEFSAEGLEPTGSVASRAVVVSVIDRSHPQRDQAALCPNDHPLDGCATVDYGAFGTPHHNRLVVEGAAGPIELNLWKDRSIQPGAEPLPPDE